MRDVVRRFAAARRMGGASLLLTAAALVTWLLPASVMNAMQYERAAIASGEVWRLVTCHWTHWTTQHFGWDAITFLFIGVACERRSRGQMLVTLLIAAVLIPLGVMLLQPGLRTYRGLSGLDSALFALLAAQMLFDSIRERRWIGVAAAGALAVGFVAKTCIEQVGGNAVFVDTSNAVFVPVPLAHLIGAIAGTAVATYRFFSCDSWMILLAPICSKVFRSVQNVPGPAKISRRSVG
jgi:rhomboid family GlyGly-CTERM serine protease